MRHVADGRASALPSTMTSATLSASSTASPPTASASASCATDNEDARPRLLQVPGRRRSRCWARRTSRSSSSSRPSGWPACVQPEPDRRHAAGAEPGAPGRHDPGRAGARVLRVTGAFDNGARHRGGEHRRRRAHRPPGDIATVRRGFADPPQPMFRVNGKPVIGLAIAMRDAGDILALGKNVRKGRWEITANLPVGIEPVLVADQAVTVDLAISDFIGTPLWQAIVIILVCSFVSLGVRPGAVVALAIPLTMAIVFAVMDVAHRPAPHLARRADHRARMLVDDAMTTVDAMLRGWAPVTARTRTPTFAYRAGCADADRNAGDHRRLHADRLRQGSAGGTPSRSSRWSPSRCSSSWLVAVVFGPLLGKALLVVPKKEETGTSPGKLVLLPTAPSCAAIRMKVADHRPHARRLRRLRWCCRAVSRQFFPFDQRPARADGGPDAAPERVDLRDGAGGQAARGDPQGRQGRRPLQQLRRSRCDPLHPDAGRAAWPTLLRQFVVVAKDLGRASGCRSQAARRCSPSSFPQRRRARLAARSWDRPSAGLCSTACRARQGRRCGGSR